jgi:hypothetical protein
MNERREDDPRFLDLLLPAIYRLIAIVLIGGVAFWAGMNGWFFSAK